MTGRTVKETHHGGPCNTVVLPEGTQVRLFPATNVPEDSLVKYWAEPLPGHPWSQELKDVVHTQGVGLYADDVELDP